MINLLQRDVNVFHFTSTLPCETWNAHRARATIAFLDKLQNLSHLNCGLQIH